MFLEVRPGEGGEDAVQFAHELFRALLTHCASEVCRKSEDSRSLIADVGESDQLGRFVGVHRIQRQPKNDKKGRRHTSTATVALVDKLPEVRVNVSVDDCEVTHYRGSGPGGQHKNKNATAVRLRHKDTGIVTQREDSRSQVANLQNALADMGQILSQNEAQITKRESVEQRNRQISTAERPVKSFTHNTQRNEVVDHASGEKWMLKDFMKGRIK